MSDDHNEPATTTDPGPRYAPGDDGYFRLRSIPDYIESRGRSAYLTHPYVGQLEQANREYAADLRALLAERDALIAAGAEDNAALVAALQTIVRGRPGWREAARIARSALSPPPVGSRVEGSSVAESARTEPHSSVLTATQCQSEGGAS